MRIKYIMQPTLVNPRNAYSKRLRVIFYGLSKNYGLKRNYFKMENKIITFQKILR